MSLDIENKKFLTGEGVRILLNELNQKNLEQAALIYNDINVNAKEISNNSSKLNNLDEGLNNKLESKGDDLKIIGNITIAKDSNNSNLQGNLIVQGDLEVKGKSITVDTETLAVKDNFIIVNSDSDGVGTSLSGIAIKTSTTDAYGIVYDPTNKSVSLGYGIITDDNDFSFNIGENNPILTRAESTELKDGQILVWDAKNHKAVGSDSYTIEKLEEKFTTWDSHHALVVSVDETKKALQAETQNRSTSDDGLKNIINIYNENLQSNINSVSARVTTLEKNDVQVKNLNESLAEIIGQIKDGHIKEDKRWVISFKPELDSIGNIVNYKPILAAIDDGELI